MQPDNGDRDYMYGLMISQLSYDGHQQLALNLASSIGCSANPPVPCDKLFRLISAAKQFNEAINPDDTRIPVGDLPLELIEKIAHHLDAKDVLEMMMVNKRLYSSFAMNQSSIFGNHVAEVEIYLESSRIRKFFDSRPLELNETLLPLVKRIDSCDRLSVRFDSGYPHDGIFLKQLKSVNRLFLWVNTKEGWLKFLTHFCGSVKKDASLEFKIGLFEEDLVMKEQLGEFIKNQLNECKKILVDSIGFEDYCHFYHEAMMKTQVKMISIWSREFDQIVGWIINQGILSKNPEVVIHVIHEFHGADVIPDNEAHRNMIRDRVQGLQRINDVANHSALVSRANELLKDFGDFCWHDKNSLCFCRAIDSTTSCIYMFKFLQFLAFCMPSQ